jgi:hypothetical protein
VTEISDVRYARGRQHRLPGRRRRPGRRPRLRPGHHRRPLSTWERPLLARHVLLLAENGRLLMLGKRGTACPIASRPADLRDGHGRRPRRYGSVAPRTSSCGAGRRGAGRRRCSPPPTRAHDRPRRPEPLDQGAARRRLPVGAIGRHMARDAAVLLGPARARRVLRWGARPGPSYKALDDARRDTWVDDSTHETTKGAAKEPSASCRTTTSRTSQSGLEERSNSRSVAAWVVIFA